MLSLPSKPWKRIRVEQQSEKQYLITFVSPLEDADKFQKIIHDDLELCLNKGDELSNAGWASKSIVLTTEDFQTFKRRLVYVCVMVESE